MDIAGLSTSMAMSNVQTSWGMKMLGNAIDTAKVQGAEMAQIIASVPTPAEMELSVNPYIGSKFDMSV